MGRDEENRTNPLSDGLQLLMHVVGVLKIKQTILTTSFISERLKVLK